MKRKTLKIVILSHFGEAPSTRHALMIFFEGNDLIGETRHGWLTYNLVWHTHLNVHGAAVVAQTLADTLSHHLVP